MSTPTACQPPTVVPTSDEIQSAADDGIDAASSDSFPASDPPAHTPIQGVGPPPAYQSQGANGQRQ